jgi:hypothetical protein
VPVFSRKAAADNSCAAQTRSRFDESRKALNGAIEPFRIFKVTKNLEYSHSHDRIMQIELRWQCKLLITGKGIAVLKSKLICALALASACILSCRPTPHANLQNSKFEKPDSNEIAEYYSFYKKVDLRYDIELEKFNAETQDMTKVDRTSNDGVYYKALVAEKGNMGVLDLIRLLRIRSAIDSDPNRRESMLLSSILNDIELSNNKKLITTAASYFCPDESFLRKEFYIAEMNDFDKPFSILFDAYQQSSSQKNKKRIAAIIRRSFPTYDRKISNDEFVAEARKWYLNNYANIEMYSEYCYKGSSPFSDDVPLFIFKTAIPPEPNCDRQFFQDYEARTYRDSNGSDASLKIFEKGRLIHSEKGEVSFSIGANNGEINPAIAIGKDVTGRGVPDLVVEQWTGSASDGGYFLIFQLGKNFRKLCVLSATPGCYFENIDKYPQPVFVYYDSCPYLFWDGCSHADSPTPTIILKWKNDGFHVAPELMLAPEVKPNVNCSYDPDYHELAESFRKDESWAKEFRPPIELVSWVVNTLYEGHVKTAWSVFDRAWPANVPGKEEYRKQLEDAIKTSPYYEELNAWWSQQPK